LYEIILGVAAFEELGIGINATGGGRGTHVSKSHETRGTHGWVASAGETEELGAALPLRQTDFEA